MIFNREKSQGSKPKCFATLSVATNRSRSSFEGA
jgi:hypothetical protein